MNLYDILGVKKTATKEEIKAAYRRKSMKHHPDRDTGNHQLFVELEEAYRILSDDKSRQHYDNTGDIQQKKPTIEMQARAFLCQMFVDIVDKSLRQKKKMEHVDIIGSIKLSINTEIEELEEEKNIGTKLIQGMKEARERIRTRTPNTPNVLEESLTTKIQSYEIIYHNIESSILLHRKALEILKDYDYDFTDPPPNPTNPNNPFGPDIAARIFHPWHKTAT